MLTTLTTLFNRDLRKLRSELELYQDESRLWLMAPGIANSAGNLALHLVGNLRTYIGATLGGVAYVRNRELEFSSPGIPRTELLHAIEETREIVERTLAAVAEEKLTTTYPLVVFEEPMSTEFFLVHLASHLAYHLGQVNYHRRLLDRP